MKIERETKAFRIHLERLGYSKSSIYMLPNCLKEFLGHQPHEQLQNITSADIINYHEYLKERPRKRGSGGLSESYINHHLYALKLFFSWQLTIGSLSECPISSLAFKTPTSKPREVLTAQEIKELFEACETLKERAVIALFYGCGLRRSEGEKLNLKDIHFRSNILYVREGKGKKRRVVPLSPQVKKELWNYAIEEREIPCPPTDGRGEDPESSGAFIINQIYKRARGSSYNNMLKIILERTQITKEITLHCLRHSIATHLLESGLSLEYVRDFLGHKHLESTQIYTRVNQKQLWSLNSI